MRCGSRSTGPSAPPEDSMTTTTSKSASFVRLLFIVFAPGAKPLGHDPFKISTNVDLVMLTVTARDRTGQPVSDLKEKDFAVYEDGVRQSIRLFRHENTPVTVGLVVDHSASMGSKLAEVTAAARTFAHTSNPQDRMFVLNFNEKVTLGLPGGLPWSSRAEDLEYAISNSPARGMTALYDALAAALQKYETAGQDKKVLVIISDGDDNASTHSLAEVLTLAVQSSALVYAIGIFDVGKSDRNPGVLRKLARVTGGEAYFPGKLADVVAICARIARDIRHQYAIGYIPTSAAPPGAWRSIHVTAGNKTDGKLAVHTRSGYIAGRVERPRGIAT